LGFGSLRRIDPGDRCHDGFPTVALRSRGFSPPQRFDPARALWLYFMPHPPLGFGLQRVPHPVSRNASQRPCSLAVESRRLPVETSTSERCSNRVSVRPTVAVKRFVGVVALVTFAPPRHANSVVGLLPSPHALQLVIDQYTQARPISEHGAPGCQSDRA
jgi:hypothetical protein